MSYYEKPLSVAERIAALKSQTAAPDAFKEVANPGHNSAPVNRTANEAQSTILETGNLEERWKRVQQSASARDIRNNTTPEKPQDDILRHEGGESKEETTETGDVGGEDDLLWQSALNRFQQESTSQVSVGNRSNENEAEKWDAVGYVEESLPSVLSREEQDIEFSRRMGDMDRLGPDYEQPLSTGGGEDQRNNESTEKLSLWQTYMVLHKRHPMLKYYTLGLVILLAATAAIIVVSLSQKNNSSSSKDCVTASYVGEPYLVLPQEPQSVAAGQSIAAGGFGTSISASSEYLVVGAPNPACNSQVSCEFTIGGGAYLYRRNSKKEWDLFSSFVLDDGKSKGDEFGKSVAISEDSTTVVVGAPKDDNLGTIAGAIYVMEQPFSDSVLFRLVSDDIGPNDEFGGSVSVSATTVGKDFPVRVTNVVAGASADDDFGSKSGSVYLFSKFDGEPPANACGGDRDIDIGKWVQCQKLLPDDGQTNDHFGGKVDIAGRTIVVGAMWDDDRGIDSGAAYVFSLDDDGSASFQEKLFPVNFESQANRYGVSVATSGELIVVGADLDDSQGKDSGAAYVYRLSNGAWRLESKLIDQQGTGRHRNFECGSSVDISNDGKTIIVGCPGAPGGGVAHVYNLQESGGWVQMEKFTVPDGYDGPNLRLGGSVASSGVDGMAVLGYGNSGGEVFSYRKEC
ncbi:hypothetical protein ACHAXR_010798 [Thalassiosira sp. AJA248-18]